MALTRTLELMAALNAKNVTDAATFRRFDLLRKQVEAAVKSYVKWDLEGVTGFVEYYDGNGYRDLVLRRPYVSKVSEVRFDTTGYYGVKSTAFAASTALVDGEDYALVKEGPYGRSGLLRRLTSNVYWFPSDLVFYRGAGGLSHRRAAFWPVGYGNLKVTYDYGFPAQVPVSTAAWAASVATFTTSHAHGVPVGATVMVSDVQPSGWNGRFVAATVPTATTFTAAMSTNPGVYSSGGEVDAVPDDIRLAVETAVGTIINTVRYGWPVQSESSPDYSYSLNVSRDVEFGTVRQLLGPYRDTSI